MADFAQQVNTRQAPGVEGDWASANPRKSVLAGEGALVSGQGVLNGVLTPGAIAARWGWTTYQVVDNDEAPGLVNSFGSGLPAGLIHRNLQGLITAWLGIATMIVPTGQQIALFNDVDMWVVNRGSTFCQVGMKAYAVFADGSTAFAATGSPASASGSASSIAAATFAATGSISDNILSVSAVGSGSVYPGASFTGTGVAAGTKILSQITPLKSGEALNGIGRYIVSIPEQVVASTALSGTYGVLTVGGTVTGTFAQGGTVTGTGISVPTTLFQQLTGGAGGAGTYVVDVNTVVASTALTSATNVETKWIAKSAGAVGELIKISNVV